MQQVRPGILDAFARWTALSALRSGAPVKSRKAIYRAVRSADFRPLFDLALGTIKQEEFAAWHRKTCEVVVSCEPRLQIGWAAKLVNIYLKTRAYVAKEGRPGLVSLIHPPIDQGLWVGLRRRFPFREFPEIRQRTHVVTRVTAITSYDVYLTIIEGCRLAARELRCELFELEQLWTGGDPGI